jgi:hypothetical protein
MFCLFYNAKTKKIAAMNGSGRASAKSTLEAVRKDLGLKDGEAGNIPETSVHAVTVPGAAAGWVDTIERFGSGKLTMEQILAPAIELAEIGFPVSDISSNMVIIPLALLDFLTNGVLVESLRKVSPPSFTKLFRIIEKDTRWLSRSKSWRAISKQTPSNHVSGSC